MTDDTTPQTQPAAKMDEKKPSSSGNNRGPKRQTSNPSNLRGGAAVGRPSSRGSNKKASHNASAPESGSDTTSRKSEGSRKPDQPRGKNQNGPGRGSAHRKGQPSASQGPRNGRDHSSSRQSASPAPGQNKESSDALSSLQRVIQDLKTTTPSQAPTAPSQPMPIAQQSSLPLHAPVFQPGASAYPGTAADQKHRKAVSLGTSTLSGNFNSFSPHLGSMMEAAEDGGPEDGEIQERYYPQQPTHQPRAQSQSFMAPRFAALAAQQEQDSVGPTGRPQLAPGFMFGAGRKRGPPMGPPINEEDMNFQFPQQQQQQQFPSEMSQMGQREPSHRKTESGEITGIMAEQVSSIASGSLSIIDSRFRSPSKIRLRLYNSNSKLSINSSLPPIRFCLSRPRDSHRTAWPPIVASRVLFL